jgi:hypothetical protein
MKQRLSIIVAGIIALAAVTTGHANVDLLERYPTKLTAGDTNPQRARAFAFTSSDIFRLAHFNLEIGQDLKIAMGAADLGLGRTVDGAVWAVIIPRTKIAATLTSSATNQPEAMAHLWFRFHPQEINRLFPPESVFPDGLTNQLRLMQIIVNAKFFSSWHSGTNAIIAEPKVLTVDVDAKSGPRRFFMVDRDAGTAKYVKDFETHAVKQPPPLTPDAAAKAFNQLWESFDRDYAMFVLRPELDWAKLRAEYYPKAMASTTTYEFADVCAEMLKPLRDLHVWITVASLNVPVFNRSRAANSNPSAHAAILGKLNRDGRVAWTVTADQIGYISISGWDTGPEIPRSCDQALEAMRNTRGLIIDVRLNGGGAEPTANTAMVPIRPIFPSGTHAVSRRADRGDTTARWSY